MLKKLFRYDMKYTARLVLPLMLLTFGTTLLGSIAMKLLGNLQYDVTYSQSFGAGLLSMALGLVIFGSILIMIVFAIISSIIVFVRFYKHFFSDEGYLTHTLPVKTSTLMFSKTWSTLLWVLITAVATIFFIFIYLFIGKAPYGSLFNMGVIQEIGQIFQSMGTEMTAPYYIEMVLLCLVSIVFATFMIFAAITIGAVVAKKHKVIAAIGFYYLINTVVSIVTVLIFAIVFLSTMGNVVVSENLLSNPEWIIHFTMIFSTVFYIGLSVGGFALCNHFLKKKLNLA